MVTGGQAGSEGKGAIAAYLAQSQQMGLNIRVAGPNAGHTVIGNCPPQCPAALAASQNDTRLRGDSDHRPGQHPWRLRQVPVAAVSNLTSMVAIAAGSEIDKEVLDQEVKELDSAGYNVSSRLVIDEQATMIDPVHRDREAQANLTLKIGSTGKGIGAARADRMMRKALLAKHDLKDEYKVVESVAGLARTYLHHRQDVMIEGTQGYQLGLHAGYYPQCTSSDCTAVDFLSMAGISPWEVNPEDLEVWVVFRTYPIRVAGNSGPMAEETTWEEIGVEPELTTVTRKVRRVGLWDGYEARAAVQANGGGGRGRAVRCALTMADYLIPELYGKTEYRELDSTTRDRLDVLVASRSKDMGRPIELVGTSPGTVMRYPQGEM